MILPPEPANFNDTSMMIDSHQSKSALINVSIERFAKLSVKARSVHNSWRLLKFFCYFIRIAQSIPSANLLSQLWTTEAMNIDPVNTDPIHTDKLTSTYTDFRNNCIRYIT
jgi:hypothetical protein